MTGGDLPTLDDLRLADDPTMCFVGVTTGGSAIMRIFPHFAATLGISGAKLVGIDLPLHAESEAYRRTVALIRDTPMIKGALVTTHKIDIYSAASDQFSHLGHDASLMHEISCIWKEGDALLADALDPITGGLSVDEIVDESQWENTDVAFLGAGGSTIAISTYLGSRDRPANMRPRRMVVTNRSKPRLESIEQIHQRAGLEVPVVYVHSPSPTENALVVQDLGPCGLIVNATGLGKDAPGSPLPDGVTLPPTSTLWDLNYRGDLRFLAQARQNGARAVDGWRYFLHGWIQHIGRVFGLEAPVDGPLFNDLADHAELHRGIR